MSVSHRPGLAALQPLPRCRWVGGGQQPAPCVQTEKSPGAREVTSAAVLCAGFGDGGSGALPSQGW